MQKKTVLLVDDYLEAALPARAMLLEMGFEAHHAPCMATATAWLGARSFDAVIADLLLEGDKGEQLLGWMRANKRPEPVIMMSEDADYELLVRLLNRGACDLLAKPLQAVMLRRALDVALGAHLLTA